MQNKSTYGKIHNGTTRIRTTDFQARNAYHTTRRRQQYLRNLIQLKIPWISDENIDKLLWWDHFPSRVGPQNPVQMWRLNFTRVRSWVRKWIKGWKLVLYLHTIRFCLHLVILNIDGAGARRQTYFWRIFTLRHTDTSSKFLVLDTSWHVCDTHKKPTEDVHVE